MPRTVMNVVEDLLKLDRDLDRVCQNLTQSGVDPMTRIELQSARRSIRSAADRIKEAPGITATHSPVVPRGKQPATRERMRPIT